MTNTWRGSLVEAVCQGWSSVCSLAHVHFSRKQMTDFKEVQSPLTNLREASCVGEGCWRCWESLRNHCQPQVIHERKGPHCAGSGSLTDQTRSRPNGGLLSNLSSLAETVFTQTSQRPDLDSRAILWGVTIRQWMCFYQMLQTHRTECWKCPFVNAPRACRRS